MHSHIMIPKIGIKLLKIKSKAKHRIYILLMPLYFFFAQNCSNENGIIATFDYRKDQIKNKFIKDPSLSVFSVNLNKINNTWIIKGQTTDTSAYKSILRLKDSLFNNIIIDNKFILLPDSILGKQLYGIVNVSVTPIREEPMHSSQMVDQAIMGNIIRLLQYHNGWYLTQTHYDYVGWINKSGLFITDNNGKNNWINNADKVFKRLQGTIFSEPNEHSLPVADIVLNNIVVTKPHDNVWTKIYLPDDRNGFIKKEFLKEKRDESGHNTTPNDIISLAKKMMGTPYLWGGNSTKGNDCSGFTQTVYKANSIQLPRDARQQALVGDPVFPSKNWGNILPGDLLFFGRNNRVTHVGISLGQKEFIHQGGKVDINSLDELSTTFSHSRFESFLFVRRILAN